MTTRTNRRRVLGVMLLLMAIAGFSCAHGNQETKEIAATPVDHEEVKKQYLKGVEESKKHMVARVNGADITFYSLINRMNLIAPDLLRSHERGPEIDAQVKKDALDILIFRELAIQEAVRRGIKAPQEKIDEAIEKTRANAGSEEAFRKLLNKTGETEESLRKDIERSLLFDIIAEQEIFSRAKTGRNKDMTVELRRLEWEQELKKDATIEITLDEVEKKLKEEAGKNKGQ